MHRRSSHRIQPLAAGVFAGALLCGVLTTAVTPRARADVVAYLVNVTVRPGYDFANADAALTYGHGLCDKVSRGCTYAQVIGEIKADFNTVDDYQASYLLGQAVNELCPALIWQLRNSAAHYRPRP
ncbi:DUF732 domain-containing protein [Mycobacterium shinjukuense]|uniref:Membrane protein n=1 Tax=Mycobacterium shinjukuense TaxID=398694 RepID=A0A7I7ML61_9MYCO|nr:DUF732 domain-containing protein [Mycobacterium shinjukuense]MCV6987440.1 DUF732 domain-containing protein [Mycobacterium shinjukuense]ORB66642.1 hypothetical protein BST45_13285 [Mycobacterium shinjukuense]BBX73024.1 membrane protein [Mycobacterium shinjukuense]